MKTLLFLMLFSITAMSQININFDNFEYYERKDTLTFEQDKAIQKSIWVKGGSVDFKSSFEFYENLKVMKHSYTINDSENPETPIDYEAFYLLKQLDIISIGDKKVIKFSSRDIDESAILIDLISRKVADSEEDKYEVISLEFVFDNFSQKVIHY